MRRFMGLFLALLLAVHFTCMGVSAKGQDVVTLTCLINHTWYPVNSFTGIIPEEITRRTGVKLNVIVAKDSRKINMMLASGELPDLIYTSSQFDTLSDPRFCYDYDALIQEYGIPWEIGEDLRSNGLHYSRDGKLYTVINHYTKTEDWQATASVPMTASLLVRQDILGAMGNPPIRTIEDLEAVYLRVRDEYPEMVPLTFDITHRFNIFRIYFGLGLADFMERGEGGYGFYARDSRYHAMLAFLNRLYRGKCLLLDNFAATSMQANALYKSGRAFSHSGCTQNYNLGMNNDLKEISPSYHSVELPPLEGAAFTDSNLGWSGLFITKNNKDPETSIRFIAWMFTPEAQRLTQWGREGIDYQLNEDNLPVFSKTVMDAISTGTHNYVYNPWFYFGASAIVESEGRCAFLDFVDYEKPYTLIREQYRNQPWVVAAMPLEGSREKEIYDTAMAMAQNFETRIIVSETDEAFETLYQEYMRLLESLPIAQLEAYVTEQIPVMKRFYAAEGDL